MKLINYLFIFIFFSFTPSMSENPIGFEAWKDSFKKTAIENNISEENETKLSQGNTVKEILYETNDNNGNRYIIKSDSGTFSEENKDEITFTLPYFICKF